jgi:uncharacterized caspase-like protein
MEQHSTISTTQEQAVVPEVQESVIFTELDASLQNLKHIAEKRYASYVGLARRSDDEQNKYTESAENFIRASGLVMEAVLRSKQSELERA